ncbi:hypothetical protein MP228_008962 [Amoeboaphelidium protococcarum]|nr:hypothetical protein MP228_008962 [Amoeboaphelidium protococcarum]
MNQDKLKELQSQVRIGGKGTPRRKMKKSTKATSVAGGNSASVAVQQSAAGAFTEDRRIPTALKKFPIQGIPMIEEVNMFKSDGKIIHMKAPKVVACVQGNMFAISGNAAEKELQDLMPGILTQMGQENLNQLKQLAEQYQKMAAAQQSEGGAAGGDDAAPELVDFEKVSENVD